MASKKEKLQEETHFHIPKDPLRVQSEAIKARQLSRQKGLRALMGIPGEAVENLHRPLPERSDIPSDLIYQMLTDIMANQEVLEAKLDRILQTLRPR